MSFPRYPKYKDSGIEWLSEVPEHWAVGSVRWLTRRCSGGTPDKTNLAYWEDGTIPWINSGAVNDRLITQPSTFITVEAFESSSAKWIPEGSLVMALAGQGKTKGMVAQLGIRTTCNQSMAAMIPSAEVKSRFLFWWLDANYQNIRNMAGGDLRDGLNLELLGNIRCPLPTTCEQLAIAAFLDAETAKIDELVAEQQRLIELLKEKRQAVISHAVTKGLNPNVSMRPSSIEGLGEVPEHWDELDLKRLIKSGTSITYGIVQAGPDVEGGVPYIRTSDMSGDQFPRTGYLRTSREIDESYARSRVRPGDLVVAIRASLGKGLLVPQFLDGANLTQGTAKVSPGDRMTSEFLCWAFNSPYCQMSIDQVAKGTTFREITLGQLRCIRLVVPPIQEQKEIASYLSDSVGRFNMLTTEAERGIELLQERRTALISAAVTGKIDVHSFAPQIPEVA